MIRFGDLVKFRTGGFGSHAKWREGHVEEIGAHHYVIAPLGGGARVTIILGGKGRKGKVCELRGAEELPAPIFLVPEARTPQELRLVHCGPAPLRAVPAPRAPYRSGPYLTFVRARECCSCSVPLCRRCHAQVTDHYTLPGRDRAEVTLHFLRVQVALLSEWTHDAEALMADHVSVPILRRVAS